VDGTDNGAHADHTKINYPVGFVKSVQLRYLRVLVDEAAEYRSSVHPGVQVA
jgi:hypothetical protein